MGHVRRPTAVVATVLVVCVLALAGCTSDADPPPTRSTSRTFVADPLNCDLDQSSLEAKDTIERVGGLVADDYVVRFSESTRAGVVALVSGDTRAAFDQLTERYTGVAIVARLMEDGSTRVTGFQQIRDLVDSACPATPATTASP